jgi:hypothetical protein
MRTPRFFVAKLLLLALLPSPLLAAVTVTSTEPDRFTDGGDRNTDPRKVMDVLAKHLQSLGGRYLPPGTDLAIEVLDLDRAGRPRMNLPTEIRVVSGKGDMPCIDLQYTLTAGGKASGPTRERVCDPEFLRPLPHTYSENDPLVYEKRMLDEWFKRRFAQPG